MICGAIPSDKTFNSFDDFVAYIKAFEVNGKWFISIEMNESTGEISFNGIDDKRQIETITIPETVEKINSKAFFCSLVKEAIILSEEIEIRDSAFSGSMFLTDVSFEKTTSANIGDSAFDGCISLNKLNNVPATLRLGENAFRGCGFTELILEDVNFDYEAFSDNSELEKIVITGNISSPALIALSNSFNNCPNLKQVWLPASYAQGRYDRTYIDPAFSNSGVPAPAEGEEPQLTVYIEKPEEWTGEDGEAKKAEAMAGITKGNEQWIWSDDTENWQNPQ